MTTTPAADLPRRLARSYSALARGLYFPRSEEDTPYDPFHSPHAVGEKISADVFRSAARLAQWWNVGISSGDDWFEQLIAGIRKHGDRRGAAAVYEHLLRAMRATLEGPLSYAVAWTESIELGFHRTRHYVFGRVDGGGLAGLMALSVET